MNRFILFTLLLFSVTLSGFANHVDALKAKTVGQNFFKSIADVSNFALSQDLNLVYSPVSPADQSYRNGQQVTYFYVFNVGQKGYVIVSGDDAVTPILGYSTEASFSSDRIPDNVNYWLNEYGRQIQYIIDQGQKTDNTITEKWENYLAGPVNIEARNGNVEPLVTTLWDQSPYVNDKCPMDTNEGSLSVTGCVATAMAQIMKFWNFPAKGTGSHTYTEPKWGPQTANFGNTTYNWAAMPDVVSGPNDAVATLMYHCGVAVEMDYSANFSGAWVLLNGTSRPCSEKALTQFFGYKNTIRGVQRSSVNDATWMTLIKTEHDAGRPILFAGFTDAQGNGGHAFVCDGYDQSDMVHINWGWGGSYNGHFVVNDLTPDGQGTGGGNGGYNFGQEILIGIQPGNGGGSGAALEVTPESLIYEPGGGTKEFTVNSTSNWGYGFVNYDDKFYTVIESATIKSNQVEIVLKKNIYPSERTARILFSNEEGLSKVVEIKQNPVTEFAMFRDTMLLANCCDQINQNMVSTEIYANTNWDLIKDSTDTWFTINSATSSGSSPNSTLQINVQPNPTGINRFAVLTLKYHNQTKETKLFLSQPGKNSGYLNVPTKINLIEGQNSVPIPVFCDNTAEGWYIDENESVGGFINKAEIINKSSKSYFTIVNVPIINNNINANETGTLVFKTKAPANSNLPDLVKTVHFELHNTIRENDNLVNTVYPNPANDFFNVSLSTYKDDILNLDLVDINGRVVKVLESNRPLYGEFVYSYSTDDLEAGIYFMRYRTESTSGLKKLMIVK